mmetsp:Transcript_17352/g.23388  ORF Transcript_17352/g.23388 Transcript_17352/m.23388 type:complete len:405 (-) Transcript_17352:300-1514(-)
MGDSGNQFAWENTGQRSWASICEDGEGRLVDAADANLLKRRRTAAQPEGTVRRGMIRYLYIILDSSRSMAERDLVLRPNRAAACTALLKEFIENFFTENPICNLGIIMTQNEIAVKISDLSANPRLHIEALQENSSTSGEASLQNSLEMAATLLGNIPDYGNREVLVLFGSISTTDPGDIFQTLSKLKKGRIRVSAIALAAEMFIMSKIVNETGGTMSVVANTDHFRQLLMDHLMPPPTNRALQVADMVEMGFPKLLQGATPFLGYGSTGKMEQLLTGCECPQCMTRMGDLPCVCVVCGLKLVSSPHLAQSYHHLFPLPAFEDVALENCVRTKCFGCGKKMGAYEETVRETKKHETDDEEALKAMHEAVAAALARFRCRDCGKVFCLECDIFCHSSLHTCPGCT